MKIINIFQKICNKLKELWNIYGGIALSTLIAWWTGWTKTSMDLWASYITLTITCIGLLTFFKLAFAKRKKNKVDAFALSSNKHIKRISSALNPERAGEEIGQTIIYTVGEGKKLMSKLKNLLKWLWGNKFTLISIISNIVVGAFAQFILYSDYLKDYQFFQEHKTVFIVVVTALTVLWLIENIYCVVTKYGLENLEELRKRSQEKKEEAVGKLTPEQKKTLKNQLSVFKKQESEIVNRLKEIDNELIIVEKTISEFTLLRSINISPTNEQMVDNQKAITTKDQLKTEKDNLTNQKSNIELAIKRIKERF